MLVVVLESVPRRALQASAAAESRSVQGSIHAPQAVCVEDVAVAGALVVDSAVAVAAAGVVVANDCPQHSSGSVVLRGEVGRPVIGGFCFDRARRVAAVVVVRPLDLAGRYSRRDRGMRR